jgi:UDP-glucose 4-epimerase
MRRDRSDLLLKTLIRETMRILVVGGAGYIGAHMSKLLAESGHEVVVLDDLSTGHRAAVRWGRLELASMAESALLDRLFGAQRFDAVMHFAALSLVGESMRSTSDTRCSRSTPTAPPS